MPRLFAETCILAHSLGIKYVWIDSICIRQDKEEEWNREAPQMARYYQNAWVTVVAANNAMANGLLNMRRTEPVPRMTRLPYMDVNGEQNGYFYLQSTRPDVLQKEYSVGVGDSELLQRGWVFQEWRLSRRIIAFSDSGFFLHCHTLGSMSPLGDHFNGAGVRLGQNSRYDDHIMQDRDFSPSSEWEDIVAKYSGLGLTYLTRDRLMALAGVASEVGRTIKALKVTSSIPGPILSDDVLARQYVCGLWLTHIHRGLIWEQATPGFRERLPGIPTWSWASMASHVTDGDDKRVLTGMRVRWPRKDFYQRQRQMVCAIHKATTVPVDIQNLLPQFSDRPVPDYVPEYEYGNENRFVVLTIYSPLMPIQIERLLSVVDADLADEVTSALGNRSDEYESDPRIMHLDHPSRKGLWRCICLPTDPSRIVGWASVEHPELQSDEKIASSSGSIYALFLERCEEKGGWFHWGSALISRVVFTILLVRRVSIPGFNESFERVGVGRLFGEEVNRRYLSTEKTTMSLV
ncbi:hypothetical protein JMJ35_005057 [Cladonia borealis]|uniref:Heterokaryon incompatibility domain-containing protein n=1 Tax=Cladonia borealis TaxID=184061 RepID=A0AA39R1F7_9LECA|nr:hypothetical protein JMJ35_005057 [Cladonia borealis]